MVNTTSIQIQFDTKENLEIMKIKYKKLLQKKDVYGSHVSFSDVVDFLLRFYEDNKKTGKTRLE